MSELLLKQCAEYRPDLVIFTPLFGPLDPSSETIYQIVNVLRIKVYIQLFDFYTARIDRWLPLANYVGIIDMVSIPSRYRGNPKIIRAYSAVNPGDFYDKSLKRDIDISFVGSVDPEGVAWPLRHEYINFLKRNGVNVVTCGGQRFDRISTEEYINILNRSKMSLSFCRRGDGASQLKGRVFEAMACKSFVLEDEGFETQCFFNAGKDLVIFRSKKDLLKKVLYYLAHDKEREEIARSGYEKVTNLYNATNMWAYVFGKMGFELPSGLVSNKNCLLHHTKMESLTFYRDRKTGRPNLRFLLRRLPLRRLVNGTYGIMEKLRRAPHA
jgi:glycosyltransferase involved in cell wall biosynthesis